MDIGSVTQTSNILWANNFDNGTKSVYNKTDNIFTFGGS